MENNIDLDILTKVFFVYGGIHSLRLDITIHWKVWQMDNGMKYSHMN